MDCAEVTPKILAALGDRLTCIEAGERLRIVTPLRRPGGDLIDVYVRSHNDGSYVVSDLGESIGFLVSMGYDPRDGTNSGFILKHIPFRYEVELRLTDGVIRTHVPDAADIGNAVWAVIEASLAVSHMLYMSRASAPSTIGDEVANVLVRSNVRFEQNKQVVGEMGRRFHVDFAFSGLIDMAPREGYVKTLSAESGSGRLQSVNATYRMWSEIRSKAGMTASIVDDRYAEWPTEDIAALSKFSDVYYWADDGERERFTDAVQRFSIGLGASPS